VMEKKLLIGAVCIIIVAASILAYYYMKISKSSLTPLVVFAGSASKPVLEEVSEEFEEETGISVELHLSGSGEMLSQMKITKSGDLYIPGSDDYMTKAIEDGAADPETVKILAYLIPAIIVQKGNPKGIHSLEDLARSGVRIGIADPKTVCVGEYAYKILKYNGLWERVEKNIVVYAESCSKVAALITTKMVDVIIGWSVFENWDPDKSEAIFIEPERIPKISCIPAALSTYSKNKDEAEKLLNFLASQKVREIFNKYGYIATLEDARKYAPNAEAPFT